MRTLLLPIAAVITFVGVAAQMSCRTAGSSASAELSPAQIRNNEKLARATTALQIIGADVPGSSHRCAGCHAIDLPTLERWQKATQNAQNSCNIASENMEMTNNSWSKNPLKRIECLQQMAANDNKPYGPAQLGMFAAGVHLPHFDLLFKAAYPDDTAGTELAQFRARMQMPHGGENKMSAEDFEAALSWIQSLDMIETVLPKSFGLGDECKQEIKPALLDYVRKTQAQGWAAKNRASGMRMFACPTDGGQADDPLACFKQRKADGSELFPAVPDLRATTSSAISSARFVHLSAMPEKTMYWTRSSPDGRFLATGVDETDPRTEAETGFNPQAPTRYGLFIDLNPLLTPAAAPSRHKLMAARYDPSFFPDGKNFMFQGSGMRSFLITCKMDTLTGATGETLPETLCDRERAGGLYQSSATGLNGSDFINVSSTYVESDGQGTTDLEPAPSLSRTASVTFGVFVLENGALQPGNGGSSVTTPFFSDVIQSPSSGLIVGRLAGVDKAQSPAQLGFGLKLVERVEGDDSQPYRLIDGGTICKKGHKATFSFDERFVTYSHQVQADEWAEEGFGSADDPAFKELINTGAINIWVTDLLTGTSTRLTRSRPGLLAQFPHFRSDGWLYFQTYDIKSKTRAAVATDAALLLMR